LYLKASGALLALSRKLPLGEEAVYVPTEVKAYNTIELGRSRFVFLPLCGENFEWNDLI